MPGSAHLAAAALHDDFWFSLHRLILMQGQQAYLTRQQVP